MCDFCLAGDIGYVAFQLNPELGTVITRPIFTSQVTADGRNAEHTQADRNAFLNKLFINTKAEKLDRGQPIPAKRGHDDPDQAAKGYLLDVWKEERRNPDSTTFYVMRGRMYVYNSFLPEIESGELPGISIETRPEGYRADGTKFGPHIKAIAFCGVDPIALPEMYNYGEADPAYASSNYREENTMTLNPEQLAQVEAKVIAALAGGKYAAADGMREKLALAMKIIGQLPEGMALEDLIKVLQSIAGLGGGGTTDEVVPVVPGGGGEAGVMPGEAGEGLNAEGAKAEEEEKKPQEMAADEKKVAEYAAKVAALEQKFTALEAGRVLAEKKAAAEAAFAKAQLPDAVHDSYVQLYCDQAYGPKFCEQHFAAAAPAFIGSELLKSGEQTPADVRALKAKNDMILSMRGAGFSEREIERAVADAGRTMFRQTGRSQTLTLK